MIRTLDSRTFQSLAWTVFLAHIALGVYLYGGGPGTVWFAFVSIACTLPAVASNAVLIAHAARRNS